mgnify:CR=1 FL=1
MQMTCFMTWVLALAMWCYRCAFVRAMYYYFVYTWAITFQVAAQTGCHAVGIEIREELHRIALSLRTHAIELAGTHRGWCFDRTNFKQGDVANASVEFTAGLHISPD